MAQDYLIGAQLDEYHLEALLGRGGMARVYRAVDVNLNRPAAIKVIDVHHRADADYVQRFKREAQAIAQLNHAHIVQLYRYGQVLSELTGDTLLYMAMQFIEGADLQYVLHTYRNDNERMEVTDISRVIREVCDALDYAHSRGVVHRDVKPSNIMLDTQGRAVLTDFGLAMLDTQTTRGEVFGSPQYIAPEQAVSSARAVPQSDLYSLGVVLFEMLTGFLPYSAGEPLQLALMHLNSPVPSPRDIRPDISEEISAVAMRALAKQPEQRFPTGRALADALDTAVASRPAPPGPRARMPVLQRGTQLRAALPDSFTPQKDTLAGGDLPLKEGELLAGESQPAGPQGSPLLPTVAAWQNSAANPTAGGPPGEKRATRRLWLAGAAAAALLLVLLCLGAGGAFLLSQLGSRLSGTPVAGGNVENGTAAPGMGGATTPALELTQIQSATPVRTPAPAQTATPSPEPTQTPAVEYRFAINRRGEDLSYFVIYNSGEVDLALGQLNFRSEKALVPGSAWDIDRLEPGQCVFARKEDKKASDLPELECELTGKIITIKKGGEGIFKEKLEVFAGDQQVGTCANDERICAFSFTD